MKSYVLYLLCFTSNCYFAQKSPAFTIESEFITKEITFKSEGIDITTPNNVYCFSNCI